jgi:hypothetical protein
MFDLQKFVDGLHEYIGRALKPILAKIEVLESRAPERGEKGEKGDPGERGIPGESVKGDPGKDGNSVTADDVLPELRAELQKAFEALPVPKDGTDGRNAFEVAVSLGYEGTVHEWLSSLQGRAGLDGKSVTPDEILPTLKQWFEALPKPANGKDGKDGTDGKSVTVSDISEFMEASIAKWALEFERRASDLIQRCIDRIEKPKDGINGKDGRDAFDLQDVNLSLSADERTLVMAFVRGDVRVERSVVLTHPIYRGVWRDGQFSKGDSVTFGGSTWIATRETSSKPELDDSWRLAVKRGRDGKDAASTRA